MYNVQSATVLALFAVKRPDNENEGEDAPKVVWCENPNPDAWDDLIKDLLMFVGERLGRSIYGAQSDGRSIILVRHEDSKTDHYVMTFGKVLTRQLLEYVLPNITPHEVILAPEFNVMQAWLNVLDKWEKARKAERVRAAEDGRTTTPAIVQFRQLFQDEYVEFMLNFKPNTTTDMEYHIDPTVIEIWDNSQPLDTLVSKSSIQLVAIRFGEGTDTFETPIRVTSLWQEDEDDQITRAVINPDPDAEGENRFITFSTMEDVYAQLGMTIDAMPRVLKKEHKD